MPAISSGGNSVRAVDYTSYAPRKTNHWAGIRLHHVQPVKRQKTGKKHFSISADQRKFWIFWWKVLCRYASDISSNSTQLPCRMAGIINCIDSICKDGIWIPLFTDFRSRTGLRSPVFFLTEDRGE